MRRLVMMVVLCMGLGVGVAGYAVAQDPPATPATTPELCASPEASPVAGSEATPVQTSGDPGAVATSVVGNIQGGLDQVSCGTPAATPAT